jgi:hypothetical protein
VEEIGDDYRERQAALLIFAGDGQKFILGFVAEFALPETLRPFRHQRTMTGDIGVTAHDFGRGIAGDDNVIEAT